MLNVSLLNKMGFKISKITCLKPNEIEHKVLSLVEQANDADINLSALLNCMVRLDEDTFEHLLNKYLETNGLESTMTRILFPFLYRIGLLWQTGSITPAYEHFFTNLVRQKIIAAIDKQVLSPLPDAKRFLLFLPPNEPHELGLLYAHYVLRQRGHRSVYMGLNLPIDHIICAHECCQPDFIVTTLTSCIKINAIEEFIVQISKTFSKSKILLSGAQAVNRSLHLPQNVQVISDFDDFIQYIENRVN